MKKTSACLLVLGGALLAALGLASLLPRTGGDWHRAKPETVASESSPDCLFGRLAGINKTPTERGRSLYSRHCASCHGNGGGGDGPLTALVHPRPRDFTLGIFKLRSTASGMPTEQDLYEVITQGMGGGSMPSFAFLSEQARRDLVDYVKSLSIREEEGGKVSWFAETPSGPSIPMTAPPKASPTLVETGRAAYQKMDCTNCHGPQGLGDGPQAVSMKDSWGAVLKPRNLVRDPFIGGDSAEAIYLRLATGIGGTPMVAYTDDRLSPQERWALAAYLRSLRAEAGTLGRGSAAPSGIPTVRRMAGALPGGPADPAWEGLDPVMIPLNAVWRQPGTTPALVLRAAHDGREVVFLLEWEAPIPVTRERRVQDYTDKAALQFSLSRKPGFIGMGDPLRPVNIWQWRSVGAVPGQEARGFVAASYPAMKRDLYPDSGNHYQTAHMAGNPMARLEPAFFEEANAQGPSTLTLQPASDQHLVGEATWVHGRWRVVMRRTLVPNDAGDVDLSPGRRVPLATAIWDGRHSQRGGQKSVSAWHTLEIEP